jgi:hypothetical protein
MLKTLGHDESSEAKGVFQAGSDEHWHSLGWVLFGRKGEHSSVVMEAH